MASIISPRFLLDDEMDIAADNYIAIRSCDIPSQPQNTNLRYPPFLRRHLAIINNDNLKAKVRNESLYEIEKWLLEQGVCATINPDILKDFDERLFNIDPKKLQSYLESPSTFEAYIHHNLSCMINAIYSSYAPKNQFDASVTERIKNWLPLLKLIGDTSAESYALTSSFRTYNTQLFVIKVPRKVNNDTLLHEAIIGLYVANKMRNILPNFMYVYGYTQCAPPVIDENKEILTWCTSTDDNQVSYLITENIVGGINFEKFFIQEDFDFQDFQRIFLQLINALSQAYKRYQYTHNDLHYGNVLIRKFDTDIAIPYYNNNDVVGYINSRFVPIIIDYGYNSARVGSQMMGKFGLAKLGIIPNNPFPMYDMYKLICYLYELLPNSRIKVITQVRAFLQNAFAVFKDGSIIDRVQRKLKNGDYYQAPDTLRSMDYDDFIRLSGSLLNFNLIINPKDFGYYNTFEPRYSSGINSCTFYNEFNKETGPLTAFEYCQAITALNNNTRLDEDYVEQAKKWINSKFDVGAYIINQQDTINDYIRNGDIIADLLDDRILEDPNPILMITPSYIENIKGQLISLVHLKERIANLLSTIRALYCATAEQNVYNNYSDFLSKLQAVIDVWKDIFDRKSSDLKVIYQKVTAILEYSSINNKFWYGEFNYLLSEVITVDIQKFTITRELQ